MGNVGAYKKYGHELSILINLITMVYKCSFKNVT